MVRPITRLTWDLVERFGGRKAEGLFSILINTNSGEIYIVPREIEHIDFACRLLNIERDEFKREPQIASHLIPVHIKINGEGFVEKIVTGISGLELYGVRHTKIAVETAHAIAHKFVEKGEVPILRKLEEDRIVYQFVQG